MRFYIYISNIIQRINFALMFFCAGSQENTMLNHDLVIKELLHCDWFILLLPCDTFNNERKPGVPQA